MAELKKYQYTWKEHTMVKTHKNSDKVKVVEWEIFESELEIKNMYFREVKGDVEVSKPNTDIIETSKPETTLDKKSLIKLYIEKFGKRPWPQWSEKVILEKLNS